MREMSAAVLMAAGAGAAATATPPHIIHMMVDDVGWNDLGYHSGSAFSPRIDALALDGVRLTNHHAFKVCSPSRSSFHTGRLPWQMGMYDNDGSAVAPWIGSGKHDVSAVGHQFTTQKAMFEQGAAD